MTLQTLEVCWRYNCELCWYINTFYTKQFLNKAPKPLLDDIQNVPPALALEQKNSVKTSLVSFD